ncbi:hypothetical protein DUI87_20127 [Hirundo rustica rustica]|uniref:Uncharacterized protein n=1 Tax=Hirundo rustica rustica TaxID=333673 RepID=A0A3M0JUX8_HIRRU|nr:hypothetical protein DUI87_20127 [Hirundo rustica rustica]
MLQTLSHRARYVKGEEEGGVIDLGANEEVWRRQDAGMGVITSSYSVSFAFLGEFLSFKEYGGGMVLHPNKVLQEPEFKMDSDVLAESLPVI